jgi:MHS family proline/betaine transporter-like MFS transporter
MTAAVSAPPGAWDRKSGIRAVIAASIGNLLEWYDFTVYAFFAVAIGRNFFPGDDRDLDLVKSFLVFGVGFVARPIGAVLIGVYGDRAGRKAALTLTIMIMALGTALIAFAPDYAAIGMGAPVLLLAGRVLQGFSAGGEIGGATAFLVEHAPPGKRGFFASWLQASMGLSNILGAMIGFGVTTLLSKADVIAWGWRIPFLIGLSIAPAGLYLRRAFDETPDFRLEMDRRRAGTTPATTPLLAVIANHGPALLKGLGVSVLWAVGPYALIIPMPAYAQTVLGYTAPESFVAAMISDLVLVASCFGAGAASDRIGRKPVLGAAAASLLLTTAPLFLWLQASHALATLVAAQCAFCLMAGAYIGVAPAALSELFATPVRATGMSLSYTIPVVALGAFAPAILTWLGSRSGSSGLAAAWYVMGAAVIAIAVLPLLPAQRKTRTESS